MFKAIGLVALASAMLALSARASAPVGGTGHLSWAGGHHRRHRQIAPVVYGNGHRDVIAIRDPATWVARGRVTTSSAGPSGGTRSMAAPGATTSSGAPATTRFAPGRDGSVREADDAHARPQ